MPRPLHYTFRFDLASPPQALWPFVADTNRFNRDIGLPSVEIEPDPSRQPNARRTVKTKLLGLTSRWVEEPFDWLWPHTFGVTRRFLSGPVRELSSRIQLDPTPTGGTTLTMTLQIQPRNLLGRALVLLQMALSTGPALRRIFPYYDHLAQQSAPAPASHVALSPQSQSRLDQAKLKLEQSGVSPALAAHLHAFISTSDPIPLSRFRPYALADSWQLDRRQVLEACLEAVRAGMLEFRWDLLCPLCRGPYALAHLRDLPDHPHCPTCNIDFDTNFERSVELTFRPSPAIREVEDRPYCVGSPQLTPHVIAQKFLPPNQSWPINPTLEPGGYRLRTLELKGGQHLRAADTGLPTFTLAAADTWPADETLISLSPQLTLINRTTQDQLFILERLAWTDQAATAAEVILLQKFRDLFSSEILRPGQQVSVGSVAILFTDLKGSTQMYRQIGDAPAFGKVMSHFDILRDSIAAEGGTLVKTIGDAVMAAFKEPQHAVRAAIDAQRKLAENPDPLQLKCGIHHGPAIAVTLNDRLDYFGTTINLAARLVSLSTGQDIVISDSVHNDSAVANALAQCQTLPFTAPLKGHSQPFAMWRIT